MASQERIREVQERNPEACPAVDAIEAVGEQWRLLVLYDLREGEKRFNELKRSTGASSRTLSDVLDTLGEEGLVRRRSEPADPIAVYYDLTEKGEALQQVFDELADWGREYNEPPVPDAPEGVSPADD